MSNSPAPTAEVPAQERPLEESAEASAAIEEPVQASAIAEEETRTNIAEPVVMEESPVYIPETQTQAVESSHALQSGAPSTSAAEVSVDPLDHLIATTHASSGFSATHVPPPAASPQAFVDLREMFVNPLKTLFASLKFTVDSDLNEYKRKRAAQRIRGFKTEILDAFSDMDSPDALRDFLEFCRQESRSVESKGVDISGFGNILALLEDFQKTWAISESDMQPRPPFAQIAAVEESIKELRNRLVSCRDGVSIDEDQFQAIRVKEKTIRSALASKEAELSELELAIRALREELVSVCDSEETISRRLAGGREEIARGEQELVALSSEIQTLRSSTVEASDAVKLGYESALQAMKLIHDDFIPFIERL